MMLISAEAAELTAATAVCADSRLGPDNCRQGNEPGNPHGVGDRTAQRVGADRIQSAGQFVDALRQRHAEVT
jgi:hypothetical protein